MIRIKSLVEYVYGEAHFERERPGSLARKAIRQTARRLSIADGRGLPRRGG